MQIEGDQRRTMGMVELKELENGLNLGIQT